MANNNQYITRTSTSLFEDDDIDDATFLANSAHHMSNSNMGSGIGGSNNASFSQLEQLRAQKADVEQRTLESTKRSLGLLHNTEQVGQATAEELAKQREQLENTNKQLDLINATLRNSQKHINGLKSVFGGLKNYLSGQRNQQPQGGPLAGAAGEAGGMNGTASSPNGSDNSYEAHPVARLRGDGPQQQQMAAPRDSFNEQLDENLDLMAGSLSRLKGLAIDLNQDIESQNDLIDNIANKVEDTDVRIGRQNRDLNKLLKK